VVTRTLAEITREEIHMGRVSRTDATRPAFTILSRNGEPVRDYDGGVSSGIMLWGRCFREF
jgi:hypothetical protein